MASGNSTLVMETGAGWTRGLRNMLSGELTAWFGTRKWWSQILIWGAVTNVIYLTTAFSAKGSGVDSIMLFNIFLGMAGAIGATILMQNAIIGEKRAGTAAWILSKPISRPAFILSKVTASALGTAVTMVLAQGAIAYLVTGLVIGDWLPPLGFLAGLGALFANIVFFLALTLMLGVLFEHPGPVIGIPLAFLFAQNLLGPKLAQLSPVFNDVLPWTLAVPLNGTPGSLSVATALMSGQPTPLTAIYVALAAAAIFVAVSIVVFGRQEL